VPPQALEIVLHLSQPARPLPLRYVMRTSPIRCGVGQRSSIHTGIPPDTGADQ
jgi:hypothetical protein